MIDTPSFHDLETTRLLRDPDWGQCYNARGDRCLLRPQRGCSPMAWMSRSENLWRALKIRAWQAVNEMRAATHAQGLDALPA